MISVITPCLNLYEDNRLEYFEKMMKSIHSQKGVQIEHIVIDGQSTDGTLKLLKEYEQIGWITKLVSEQDKGIYSAMNKGIRLATGEFVNIMNTDDYLLDPDYFKKCLRRLKDKNIDFVHADRKIFSRENDETTIKRGDESVAFFKMPFRHQTMIVKKEIFDEIGLFDENYKIAADYKFIMGMLLTGKKGYHFKKVVLNSFGGGASSNRARCIEEVSKVLFESYGKKHGLTKEDCKKIYLQKIDNVLFTKLKEHVKNKKIINSLRQDFKLSKLQNN